MPRSDMFHTVCAWASVCSETKSQKVSCALCACGISRSGCGFAAWMMSGNLMPSWIKNTVSLAMAGLGLAGSVDAGRSAWRVTRKNNCPLWVRFPRFVRAGWSGRR
jgi:hypothetical protein